MERADRVALLVREKELTAVVYHRAWAIAQDVAVLRQVITNVLGIGVAGGPSCALADAINVIECLREHKTLTTSEVAVR